MTYYFHTDPGHGWLAVKKTEVKRLGIEVSEYSYQKGDTVYLEEDMDAVSFFMAKKALGEEVSFKESYQENTPIRNYARYSA